MQEEINGLRRGCKALRFVSMAGAALLNPRGEKFKQLKKTLLRGIIKIRDLTIAAVKLNNRKKLAAGN